MMRKIFFVIVLIFFTLPVYSNKTANNNKLVECIIEKYRDYTTITKFKYDNQNRIVKVINYLNAMLNYTQMISYNNDTIIVSGEIVDDHIEEYLIFYKIKFIKNGNKINIHKDDISYGPETITINENNFIERKEEQYGNGEDGSWYEKIDYYYNDNNLIKLFTKYLSTNDEKAEIKEFKYDTNISPFYNCKSPKWLLQYLFFNNIDLNNNITENKTTNITDTYTYYYDNEKFPTTKIRTRANSNCEDCFDIHTFIYQSETNNLNDTSFNIYDNWEYFSDNEWGYHPPNLIIYSDNVANYSVDGREYKGVLIKTNQNQFHFQMITMFAEGDLYQIDEEMIFIYNSTTNMLEFDNYFLKRKNAR